MTKRTHYDAVPQLRRLRDDVLYGDVWQQPELKIRDRSLVTCAILATLGKSNELEYHMELAIKNGVSADELRGLVVQVSFYAGWPAGINTAKAGMAVFESETQE